MPAILHSIGNWGREVRDGWNRFWFTPADPATIGVIRICTGAMLLYTHLVWSLDLEAFFGPRGWLPADAASTLQSDSYTFSYFWWISAPWLLWTVHALALVVFAMMTLGLFTRAVSILALVAAISYASRAQGALFGLDQINLMLAMYLALGPSGDAFSLDAWRKGRGVGPPLAVQPKWTANLAIRLIQVHLCIIYLFAGAAKLTGQAWWDGTALWMALGNYEYQSMDLTWLADWPYLVNVMTHVTIAWELFYVALIWPRLTRPVMLLLAIPLHMGIAICLGMVTFGLIMLVANLAFVPPWFVRSLWPFSLATPSRAGEFAKNSTAAPAKAVRSESVSSRRPA